METKLRTIFNSQGIPVPEEDYPILQAQWEWISGLKERTKEMEAGSYDIALTHLVRGKDE